jgi:uncharacterized protein YegL
MNLAQTALDQALGGFPDSTKGAVPSPSRRGTRFPMLFLIDTSGSTGFDPQTGGDGPGADIHRINTAIEGMFRNLRYPTDGTDLAAEQDNIDVSLITYNDSLRVEVPWTMATQLDPNLVPFKADGGTRTGAALGYGLGYIGHRIRYYIGQNIKHGRPTIIHFTDGAPTDMTPGDANWKAVQARLHKVSPLNDPEKRFAVIRHLIAANGADPLRSQLVLGGGLTGTGLQVLSQLSGAKSTLALEDHPDLVGELVEFMTTFVEGVTNIFGSHEADPDEVTDTALQDLTHIKRCA